jgi:hypothetical protein
MLARASAEEEVESALQEFSGCIPFIWQTFSWQGAFPGLQAMPPIVLVYKAWSNLIGAISTLGLRK